MKVKVICAGVPGHFLIAAFLLLAILGCGMSGVPDDGENAYNGPVTRPIPGGTSGVTSTMKFIGVPNDTVTMFSPNTIAIYRDSLWACIQAVCTKEDLRSYNKEQWTSVVLGKTTPLWEENDLEIWFPFMSGWSTDASKANGNALQILHRQFLDPSYEYSWDGYSLSTFHEMQLRGYSFYIDNTVNFVNDIWVGPATVKIGCTIGNQFSLTDMDLIDIGFEYDSYSRCDTISAQGEAYWNNVSVLGAYDRVLKLKVRKANLRGNSLVRVVADSGQIIIDASNISWGIHARDSSVVVVNSSIVNGVSGADSNAVILFTGSVIDSIADFGGKVACSGTMNARRELLGPDCKPLQAATP